MNKRGAIVVAALGQLALACYFIRDLDGFSDQYGLDASPTPAPGPDTMIEVDGDVAGDSAPKPLRCDLTLLATVTVPQSGIPIRSVASDDGGVYIAFGQYGRASPRDAGEIDRFDKGDGGRATVRAEIPAPFSIATRDGRFVTTSYAADGGSGIRLTRFDPGAKPIELTAPIVHTRLPYSNEGFFAYHPSKDSLTFFRWDTLGAPVTRTMTTPWQVLAEGQRVVVLRTPALIAAAADAPLEDGGLDGAIPDAASPLSVYSLDAWAKATDASDKGPSPSCELVAGELETPAIGGGRLYATVIGTASTRFYVANLDSCNGAKGGYTSAPVDTLAVDDRYLFVLYRTDGITKPRAVLYDRDNLADPLCENNVEDFDGKDRAAQARFDGDDIYFFTGPYVYRWRLAH